MSLVSLPLQIHHHIALFATAMGHTSLCTSPYCTLRHWTGSHLFYKYITILHPLPLFWITLLQSHQDILLTTLGHTSMSLVTMVDSTKFVTVLGDGSGQYICDFERNPTILPLPFFLVQQLNVIKKWPIFLKVCERSPTLIASGYIIFGRNPSKTEKVFHVQHFPMSSGAPVTWGLASCLPASTVVCPAPNLGRRYRVPETFAIRDRCERHSARMSLKPIGNCLVIFSWMVHVWNFRQQGPWDKGPRSPGSSPPANHYQAGPRGETESKELFDFSADLDQICHAWQAIGTMGYCPSIFSGIEQVSNFRNQRPQTRGGGGAELPTGHPAALMQTLLSPITQS